jgi:hypothetical protein
MRAIAQVACHNPAMARSREALGAVAALGATAIVIVGCGSTSYSGPNLAKGLSPAQLQVQSEQHAAQLKSFVLGVGGNVAMAIPPRALGASVLAPLATGTPVPISGSGPVVAPDAFSLGLTLTVAGAAIPVALTQTGGHVYVVALGRNMLLPTKGPIANLQTMVVGIMHAMTTPMTGSTITIAGIPSIELSGSLNGQEAARGLAPLLSHLPTLAVTKPSAASQQALVAALSQGTVHDWVRVSDLRPARVEIIADIPNGSAASPALEHASMDLTFNLSGFNQPQTITPPAHPVPMTTQQLQGLLAG